MSHGLQDKLLHGRYRIGRELGRGGMSVVLEAEDLRLSRTVAIKLIRGAPSGVSVERLFREAKAAARADHPAIVTVYGYGSDEATGYDYIVMERLRGTDVATRLAGGKPLPLDLVRHIALETADALSTVHDAGIIHRDLKPANIFLAQRGRHLNEVKLLDFGIAKQLDLQTLTSPGQIIGTLAYMPLEQLTSPKTVDARVDIYALGVSLYQCLTGRLPFLGESVAEIAARMMLSDVRSAPLSKAAPEVPRGLANIVDRCMEKQPDDRFINAHALREALLAV